MTDEQNIKKIVYTQRLIPYSYPRIFIISLVILIIMFVIAIAKFPFYCSIYQNIKIAEISKYEDAIILYKKSLVQLSSTPANVKPAARILNAARSGIAVIGVCVNKHAASMSNRDLLMCIILYL